MLQSVAPGSPPDDPVRGLVPSSSPPRMLQSRASFCHILFVASDAPVRGTGFTPGRSSPGASAVLLSATDAPIRGAFLSYSLRCLGCSSPWHQVHPRTIQSVGLGRAPPCPGCTNPGRHSFLLSLLSSAFACVVHWCFFFARPSSLLLPRFPRSALLSLPPFPLPLCPRHPRYRFSLPQLPFPPFVVALLGHALKLIVSTRTHVHSSSFCPPFSLFLCFVPVHVPSLVACTLCCLCFLRVLSSFVCLGHAHMLRLLRMQFATHLFSFVLHSCRTLFMRCTLCSWRRPRVGVCTSCIHPPPCYLHDIYAIHSLGYVLRALALALLSCLALFIVVP